MKNKDENASNNGADAAVAVNTGLGDLTEDQQQDIARQIAGGEKNSKDRVVGYILAPEVFVGLLDICEDIPGRYYKKIVPALQASAMLIENEDGTARVVNTT